MGWPCTWRPGAPATGAPACLRARAPAHTLALAPACLAHMYILRAHTRQAWHADHPYPRTIAPPHPHARTMATSSGVLDAVDATPRAVSTPSSSSPCCCRAGSGSGCCWACCCCCCCCSSTLAVASLRGMTREASMIHVSRSCTHARRQAAVGGRVCGQDPMSDCRQACARMCVHVCPPLGRVRQAKEGSHARHSGLTGPSQVHCSPLLLCSWTKCTCWPPIHPTHPTTSQPSPATGARPPPSSRPAARPPAPPTWPCRPTSTAPGRTCRRARRAASTAARCSLPRC